MFRRIFASLVVVSAVLVLFALGTPTANAQSVT